MSQLSYEAVTAVAAAAAARPTHLADFQSGYGNQLNPKAREWLPPTKPKAKEPAGNDLFKMQHRISSAQNQAVERMQHQISGAQNQAAAKRRMERAALGGGGPAALAAAGIGNVDLGTPVIGGNVGPEALLGSWADSLGNSVTVSSVDAFSLRLEAVLSQPPRKDIKLAVRPFPGGGWICGNAKLDLTWSGNQQLHWLTGDGRVSVWVRLSPEADDKDSGDK